MNDENPIEENEFSIGDVSDGKYRHPKNRSEALRIFNESETAKGWTAFMVVEHIEQMV